MTDAVHVDPTEMPVVFACDVGSVPRGRCHWARHDSAGHASGDLPALVDAIAASLDAGRRVALGAECPLFVPVPADAMRLGKARDGDCIPGVGNRSFTASAGATATATGVPIIAWVLRAIRSRCPRATGTTDARAFADGTADLLLWEAFVTGPGSAGHLDDAQRAADAFAARWASGHVYSDVAATAPFSLAGALLLWSNLSEDLALLCSPCLAVRPPPLVPLDRIEAIVPVDAFGLMREHDWRSALWLRPNPRHATFDDGSAYALTIDGYACVADRCRAERLDVSAVEGAMYAVPPGASFDELRARLFYMQRSTRWSEASRVDVEGRALFAACYTALCEAWTRESPSHHAEVVAADREVRGRLAGVL